METGRRLLVRYQDYPVSRHFAEKKYVADRYIHFLDRTKSGRVQVGHGHEVGGNTSPPLRRTLSAAFGLLPAGGPK